MEYLDTFTKANNFKWRPHFLEGVCGRDKYDLEVDLSSRVLYRIFFQIHAKFKTIGALLEFKIVRAVSHTVTESVVSIASYRVSHFAEAI